jgi:hypothetical protein
MATEALDRIEHEFARLPPQAQLDLLERLVHRVRVDAACREEARQSELSAMAADTQIQRELQQINAEFSAGDADGLEKPCCLPGAARSTSSTLTPLRAMSRRAKGRCW